MHKCFTTKMHNNTAVRWKVQIQLEVQMQVEVQVQAYLFKYKYSNELIRGK